MSNRRKINNFWGRFTRLFAPKKGKRGIPLFSIDKRQKFVVSVLALSLGLFLAEFQFSKSGFYVVFFLSCLTDLLLFWAIYADIKENKAYHIFSHRLFFFLE
jgi:hypothetical protein